VRRGERRAVGRGYGPAGLARFASALLTLSRSVIQNHPRIYAPAAIRAGDDGIEVQFTDLRVIDSQGR
jgi:hypothetical protein